MIFLVGCVSLIALADSRKPDCRGSAGVHDIDGRVQWPFVGLSTTWGSVQQGLGAADRVFAVMDIATEDGSPRRLLQLLSACEPSTASRNTRSTSRTFRSLFVWRQLFAGLNLQVDRER